MIAQYEVSIDVNDEGEVTIAGPDAKKVDAAAEAIRYMTRDVEVGEVFDGIVVRIVPFGAFIELIPGRDGLLHVSKMGRGFVKDPADVVKEGQNLRVRVAEIDSQGRISLELVQPDAESA
jgi:polyribonucleotide nucleotidyltransferase